MKLIEMNIDKIIALCKKYKVAKHNVPLRGTAFPAGFRPKAGMGRGGEADEDGGLSLSSMY